MNFQVAIDGPAGSGKSTISALVAQKLNFTRLDTGAMYRAVTLVALKRNIDIEKETKYDFLNEIEMEYKNGHILVNHVDYTSEIRSLEVTRNVSQVSANPVVRQRMKELQQKIAQRGKMILDGRDIGYNVLPNADLKIYLTASIEERAKRRMLEYQEKGIHEDLVEVQKELKRRDEFDSTREFAPLKKADDAIEIDTTNMSIEGVVDEITGLITERMMLKMESMKEFESMEDFKMNKLRVGQVVTATVIAVKDNELTLDLNYVTEGTMYLEGYTNEKLASFKDVVKVNDQIEAQVTKISERDDSVLILLSRIPLLKKESIATMKAIFENKETITAKVSKVVNKGVICKYKGNEVFVPESQLEFNPNKDEKKELDLNSYLGKDMTLVLIDFDDHKNRIVGSHRVLAKEEFFEERNKEKEALNQAYQEEVDSINQGDVKEGTIDKIEKYGILVRFNHVRGLLKFNQLDHKRVENIEEVFHVGDPITVKVMKKENNKFDLSRKALIPTPHEQFKQDHKIGEKITGTVVQKLPFGTILEVAEGVTALLHKNEYSWNPNDNFQNNVTIGSTVEVAILSIDAKKKKVSVSKKALEDNPWNRVTVKVGDIVEAKVANIIASKALEVEVQGVNGYISISDLSTEKVAKIEAIYAVGDSVTAEVIECNPKEWNLRLSIRKMQEDAQRDEFNKYMDQQEAENQAAKVTIGDIFEDELKK